MFTTILFNLNDESADIKMFHILIPESIPKTSFKIKYLYIDALQFHLKFLLLCITRFKWDLYSI